MNVDGDGNRDIVRTAPSIIHVGADGRGGI